MSTEGGFAPEWRHLCDDVHLGHSRIYKAMVVGNEEISRLRSK